jgi:hypothetical protein
MLLIRVILIRIVYPYTAGVLGDLTIHAGEVPAAGRSVSATGRNGGPVIARRIH